MKLFISRFGIIGVILLSGSALASCQTRSPTHLGIVAPTTTNTMDPTVARKNSTPVLKPAGSAGDVAVNTNTAAISALKKEPRRSLPTSRIGVLSLEEEEELVKTYRGITNSIGRYGVAKALALGGGDATFQVFRNTLENEFAGRLLTTSEEGMVLQTARLLGLLAHRSKVALEYLKQGCFSEHWAHIKKWKGTRNDTDFYLANYCIQGVGLAGTAEARAFLVRLPEQMNQQQARDLYSAVLSAAADLDISDMQGRDKFLDEIFMKEEHFAFVEQWRDSEKAKPWLEWRDRVKRGE